MYFLPVKSVALKDGSEESIVHRIKRQRRKDGSAFSSFPGVCKEKRVELVFVAAAVDVHKRMCIVKQLGKYCLILCGIHLSYHITGNCRSEFVRLRRAACAVAKAKDCVSVIVYIAAQSGDADVERGDKRVEIPEHMLRIGR